MHQLTSTDVAVVGAGAVGCVTALACARAGAQVLLLEAQPQAARRLAGEWVHPAGAAILQRLGVGAIPAATDHPAGRGFVVYPHDKTPPIALCYAEGTTGLSCEHHLLVAALREAAASHPNVDFISGGRATQIEGQQLSFMRADGAKASIVAERIVGADGRSSFVRNALDLPNDRSILSHTAGVLLHDAELPFEGFGHVLLGGPGPVLIYRISAQHLRACLDVPANRVKPSEMADYLWSAYSPVFPPTLHAALRRALDRRQFGWAANQFRRRTVYGREGLALVGDAVGHFHPLTASGLTLGFMDGECLASSTSVADYQHKRTAQTRVPELLAIALYKVFTLSDESSIALGNAVYRMWRQDAGECLRTMRLLAVEETNMAQFSRAFLKVMAIALRQLARETLRPRHWQHTTRTLGGFGAWLLWLMSNTMPALTRPRPH